MVEVKEVPSDNKLENPCILFSCYDRKDGITIVTIDVLRTEAKFSSIIVDKHVDRVPMSCDDGLKLAKSVAKYYRPGIQTIYKQHWTS